MRWVAVLLVLLVLPFVPTASALTIEGPRYDVGDEWSYAVTVTENGAVVEQGDRHFVVISRGPVDHGGASREGVTVAQHENTTFDGEVDSSSSTTVYDAATGAFLLTRSGEHETVAVAPCVEIEYPVEFGDRWTATCQVNDVTTETFYQVVGGETLVVAAGSYETLAVDKVGDHTGRIWLAEGTCGRPVAEFYQVNDRATYVNLTSASCRRSTLDTPAPTPTTTPGVTPTSLPATPTSVPTPTPGAAGKTLALPTFTDLDNWHWESTGIAGGTRVNTTANVFASASSARFQGNVNVTAPNGTTMLAYLVESSIDTANGAIRSEKVSPYVGRELLLAAGYSTFGERRYDAPCAFVQWPIVPGRDWSYSCEGKIIDASVGGTDTAFHVTGTGRALPTREVTTPAGTFTGFPVELSYRYSDGFSRTETRVYAAEACAYVQMIPGPLGGIDELRGFYCDATKQGELVPEEGPDRPTPGAAVGALLAVAGVAALALRRKRS